MTAPLILTSGEPAGIAPEITAAAWAALRHEPGAAFALLGDAAYWQARNPGLAIAEIATPSEALALYERGWRHLDPAAMANHERELLAELVSTVGNGHLLV